MSPSIILVEDTSIEPRQVDILDCGMAIPKKENIIWTEQTSIHDMCCLLNQKEQLLVTCHLSQGLVAYNIQSGTVEWRIKEKVPGLEGDIVPQSIAADDQGHLFVSDINNDMVHNFSSDGKFLGTVLCNVGEAKISWSRTASALVVMYRRGHQWYLKICDE